LPAVSCGVGDCGQVVKLRATEAATGTPAVSSRDADTSEFGGILDRATTSKSEPET
jgi:hypothetical protein